jgi:hypothetical protein
MLMTISRAQMGSQLKGNKMYKKSSVGSMLAETIDGKKKDKNQTPVRTAKYGGKTKKKSLGGALAGGIGGKLPLMGILPMAYNAMQKKKKAKAAPTPAEVAKAQAMQTPVSAAKHGGKIGRGDGCAVRGKTKGTMR